MASPDSQHPLVDPPPHERAEAQAWAVLMQIMTGRPVDPLESAPLEPVSRMPAIGNAN
jgi:hypothetical protein